VASLEMIFFFFATPLSLSPLFDVYINFSPSPNSPSCCVRVL
jgi:hypothetical protein